MSDPRLRLALLLFSCTLLCAQSGSTGALEGTVLDAAGAPVPNASITIHNPATDQSLTATTDEKGGFRFSLLEPATYEITFTTTGTHQCMDLIDKQNNFAVTAGHFFYYGF